MESGLEVAQGRSINDKGNQTIRTQTFAKGNYVREPSICIAAVGQNYWMTQNTQDPPWYAWDTTNPAKNRRIEEPIHNSKKDMEKVFKEDLRNYLLSSTLHGLRYIGERKLTWCESINPENMALGNLPFPALTICNVNQAKKSVAERDPVDKKLLQSLCTTRDDTEIFEDDIAGSADWDHTRSFLINVTQPCNEMLAMCEWDSKTMDCQDLFNAQLTDEGLCCTFNVVHRNNMFRNPNIGEIYGPGIEARVVIRPRILDAQAALRSIDISKRLCLTYTLKNCEMECEARAMLDICKCNKSTRVCGKADARCYTNMTSIMPEACTEIAYFERVSTAPLTPSLVEHLALSLDNRTLDYFT
ncbi:Uncharacterized protein OBRU01_02645 [Operophtera brumata]|uniref:Pickpocket n=1 Tax=Operophtera brumata TaxID=104452 RepID=A0A0L7LSE5_OPEBR|nr:Uncharacterized protein OBRU01_02645 [Operophtera brumata]